MADEADRQTAARLSELAQNPIRALSARDAKQVTSHLKDWIKAVPGLAASLAEGSVARDFIISAFTLSPFLRDIANISPALLAEALDLLVDGASRILRELSAGQYELVHDKGEFYVVDHHDAALRRAVRTLSGGETFQASLALALALSEQLAGLSTGTASLESILLDEGFGTLDAASLDTVAATLENLAARGDRMVGVVTHVDALAERVPVRLRVSKDARSARVQRVGP